MTQQEILIKLKHLQEQLDEIKNYVLQKDSKSTRRARKRIKDITPSDYQIFFTWQEKIIFIIRLRSKPQLSSDIVSFMDDFDIVFEHKHTELDKVKMLSTHLNRAVKKGVITRFKQPGERGYYYSLPE